METATSTATEFAHQIVMTKHDITSEKLPKDVRQRLTMWKAVSAKKDPSIKTLNTIRKKSVELADDILDLVEIGLPEEYATEVNPEFKKTVRVENKEPVSGNNRNNRHKIGERVVPNGSRHTAVAEDGDIEGQGDVTERNIFKDRLRKRIPAYTSKVNGLNEQEQAIMNVLNKDNKIFYLDLENIIEKPVGLFTTRTEHLLLDLIPGTNYFTLRK